MGQSVFVTFVDRDRVAKSGPVARPRYSSVLDAAHASGVPIEATCGGRGRCRSCRIKLISGEVPPASVQEVLQLGADEVREGFRLACQTKLIEDITVADMPPKSEGGHQILGSGADIARDGFAIASGVKKHFVTAKTPKSEHHQTSDLEETLAVLPGPVDRNLPLELLRDLPMKLRRDAGRLTVTEFNGRVIDIEAGDTTQHCYGMAFDIGTTSIVGSLMDLTSGEQLAEVGGMNPQAVYGGDLMSRIAYAQFDDKKLATLRGKVLLAVNDFIKEACAKAGIHPGQVYKIIVVGNTCMHHVFLGVDVTYVGLAPYSPVLRHPVVVSAGELPLKAAPRAQVCLLPLVAGFVGADTMACILATRIYESEEIRALVDIGTNGEVVMGNKDRLMACSAPAGPALEGAQIRHGMRGALGAIEKVSVGEDLECTVIGGVPAIGICGSGLIDACAKLVDARVLDSSGRLRRERRELLSKALRERLVDGAEGCQFVLVAAAQSGKEEAISLTQADIRQLQLAKSAIFSGIVLLQRVMDVPNESLEELMLCGGFGNYINIESALKIRLLPGLRAEQVSYRGNAALTGAQMALLSERERNRAEELAARIEHVALAARPDFQDIFVDGMNFGGISFIAEKRQLALAAESAQVVATAGG
jgi:uncharacterized 2Fe-2S/4Fe-4S cluster protein (DUF4445 family)